MILEDFSGDPCSSELGQGNEYWRQVRARYFDGLRLQATHKWSFLYSGLRLCPTHQSSAESRAWSPSVSMAWGGEGESSSCLLCCIGA